MKILPYYGNFEKPLAHFIRDLEAVTKDFPKARICFDQHSDDGVHLWIDTGEDE